MDIKRAISAAFASKRSQESQSERREPQGGLGGPNERAWSSVDTFVSQSGSPRYALLIDGPWGVGKTHFQQAIQQHFGADKIWLYVSVYGLSSKAEIDKAVFTALYPQLSGDGAKVVGAIGKAALSFANIDLNIDLQAIMDRKSIDVIVFDDVERSALPPGEILGYLNNFVEHEHDGLKVILIANVEAMAQNPEFAHTREKVIGRTVRLKPDIDAALQRFVAGTAEDEREILSAASDQFKTRFLQSEVNNLRILHQAIWDAARITAAMSQEQRANAPLLKSVFDLVIILSIELRTHGIREDDLSNRRPRWNRAVAGVEGDAFRRLAEKYPGADIAATPISDSTLRSLLLDGVVDPELVRQELDRSRFMHAEREPEWRIVWRAHELPDSIVEPAIDEMIARWNSRDYLDYGEILHVFGLRLWLSEIGRISQDAADLEAEARGYVDDLLEAGTLPAVDRGAFMHPTGHGGYGFMKADSENFRSLRVYLHEKQIEGDRQRLPASARGLIEEMRVNPSLFARRIVSAGGDDATWARIPILMHFDAEEFVNWLLEQDPSRQREVFMAISARYDYDLLNRELAEEREWLGSVRLKLAERSNTLTPVARDRVRNNVKWFIAPRLDGEPPN